MKNMNVGDKIREFSNEQLACVLMCPFSTCRKNIFENTPWSYCYGCILDFLNEDSMEDVDYAKEYF